MESRSRRCTWHRKSGVGGTDMISLPFPEVISHLRHLVHRFCVDHAGQRETTAQSLENNGYQQTFTWIGLDEDSERSRDSQPFGRAFESLPGGARGKTRAGAA